MGKLDSKVAIVTGAGRGVGRGIALSLAREGAAVVIAELIFENAIAVAEEIKAFGGSALAVHCDVTSKDDVSRTVAATAAEFGTVDILVNNAQRWTIKPFIEMTDEDMRLTLDTGLWPTFWFMQACFPYLKEHGGKVINLGSGAGSRGLANFACYAAAKEAIRALTRVAALEWGKYDINVNCICPAADAPLMVQFARENPEVLQAFTRNPIPRLGSCENDIGPVALFLASQDSNYVTGHTFWVDGGAAMDAGH